MVGRVDTRDPRWRVGLVWFLASRGSLARHERSPAGRLVPDAMHLGDDLPLSPPLVGGGEACLHGG